jgi:hypothetical protein
MVLQAAEHPWIVLVEDDEFLERELASAIERALPGVKVRRTPDADLALALVSDPRSSLLITEAHSDSVDGRTLAACARRQRSTLPVIFLSDDCVGERARVAMLGGSHVIGKPPQVQQLIALVARILDAPPGFRGELRSHDVIELVQLVVMTMPTGALYLWTDEEQGSMWFDQGTIVHAVSKSEQGVAAFQHMMTWTGGDFSVEAKAEAPARSITLSTQHLLLEGTRLLDELSMEWPMEQSGVESVLRSPAEHFERGLEAVREKLYADALPEFERAASMDPANRVYQHNLRRLRDLLALEPESKTLGGRK